jgi:hypothetical protein
MAELPYTLLVPHTPEDEAFDEVERAQQWKVEDIVRRDAQIAAMQFIQENDVIELGIMTLRKAFETGYRAGIYAEKRTKSE